jgi:two-component system capsular synthesis response regulator RcsB
LPPVNSAREALSQLDSLPCDVLIVDYTLSRDESDGCGLLRRIAQHLPHTRVLVWATNASSAYCTLACLAGARSFLSKSHGDLQDLVDAVRTVASGRTYVPKRFRAEKIQPDNSVEDPVASSLSTTSQAALACLMRHTAPVLRPSP